MRQHKKNLVFITTDQQRFDSLPSYGAAFSIAPNLERLAADGVVFERCYVPAPVCVPTRASIMSGRFPSAHGVIDNFSWLPVNTGTWIQEATDAGYRTAGIGKMHFSPWDAMFGFTQRIIC
jgi:arylsulfatase